MSVCTQVTGKMYLTFQLEDRAQRSIIYHVSLYSRCRGHYNISISLNTLHRNHSYRTGQRGNLFNISIGTQGFIHITCQFVHRILSSIATSVMAPEFYVIGSEDTVCQVCLQMIHAWWMSDWIVSTCQISFVCTTFAWQFQEFMVCIVS